MINIGIIGAGRIGRVHGESISKFVPNAKVKAIADPFLNDNTIAWANALGITETYTDYKKILADKDIQAVLICASTDMHSPLSIEAIQAGKHVFCEKPIDHDVNKIKEVLDVVNASGLKYQVGFNRRFDHNFRAIKEAVASGKIGKQQIIKVTSRDPEAPPIEYVKVSGGIFLDMTIHDFDMVRYLSGSEVTEVFAVGSVTVDPAIGEAGDIDTAVITLKLANGATAVIDNCRKAVYGYDQRAEVFGTKGAIGSTSAVLNVASGYAFGCVIAALPAFAMIKSALLGLSFGDGPLFSSIITTNIMVGITGSSSAGLMITVGTFGQEWLTWAQQIGMSPEVLHRIICIASEGFDTVPHAGALVTLMAVCGLTHKESYYDIFVLTLLKFSVAFICLIAYMLFGLV